MATATIAAGQTTSAPLTIPTTGATGSQRISGLSFPAGWIAGTVSFLVSNDNGQTYQSLNSPSGSLYTVTAATNSYIPVDRNIMATVTNLMIVSSVTQTSAMTVTANVTDVSLPNLGTVAGSSGGSTVATVPVTTIAASGATRTLVFASSGDIAYDVTLSQACTFTLGTAPSNGTFQRIYLIIRPAGFQATLPPSSASLAYAGGAAPTPSTSAITEIAYASDGTAPVLGGV